MHMLLSLSCPADFFTPALTTAHHLGFHTSSNTREERHQPTTSYNAPSHLSFLLGHRMEPMVVQGRGLSVGTLGMGSSSPLLSPSFASKAALSSITAAGSASSRSTPIGLGCGSPLLTLRKKHGPHSTLMQTRSYGDAGQYLGNAYLIATDIMFWSGLIGAVVFRRNLIVMLLTTEVVMLACNLNFLFGAAYMNDLVVSSCAALRGIAEFMRMAGQISQMSTCTC